MAAQMAQDFQSILEKNLNDQHFSAMHAHIDMFDYTSFQNFDYSKLRCFLLFPNFLSHFKKKSMELIKKKQTLLSTKLRAVGYLTLSLVFLAQNHDDFINELKFCFDLAFYLRASDNLYTTELESENFDPRDIPFFQQNMDGSTLKKALFLLLDLENKANL